MFNLIHDTMSKTLILEQISREELRELIAEVLQSVTKTILPKSENEYITRVETAQKLGLSLVTLNEYTKSGIIPAYRIGSRVRYKSKEVEASLLKVQSVKGRRL
jgi:excisionase family DNA binding protein